MAFAWRTARHRNGGRSWRRGSILACFCLGVFALESPALAGDLPSEREVQAVLLLRLTQFITWPAANSNQPPEFVIGVLGPDPFGAALDTAVEGESVDGRPIRVLRANRASDLARCQMVYASPRLRQPLSQVFQELSRRPVLTVGETDEFLRMGGMIRFKLTSERKTRLEVHLTRTRQHGFTPSAQLLRVCDIIDAPSP